ncbi:conjugal transfer protein TraG N-terminal domain-containing protein [Vibrio mediterranei]
MLVVHVYSSGAVVRDVLNAVAMLTSGSLMHSMVVIALTVGIPVTAWGFVTKGGDWRTIARWFVVAFLTTNIALNIKEDVQIIDASDPMNASYTVSNVPFALAIPAYLSTTYMHGITETLESVLHTNNDRMYTKTGMIFGATLLKRTMETKIDNPDLLFMWQKYTSNCIRQDVMVNHKYTMQELENATDVFDFLTNHSPSPLRRIVVPASIANKFGNRIYPTCKEALPVISAMFDKDVSQVLSPAQHKDGIDGALTRGLNALMGMSSHHSGAYAAKAQLHVNHALSSAANHYMGVSQDANLALKQAMVTHALYDGAINNSYEVGVNPAKLALKAAQMDIQNQEFMAAMANRAITYIPMLHTVILLIIMAATPIVIALSAFVSLSARVWLGMLAGYANIAAWPMIFVIINFISQSYGEVTMHAFGSGLTIHNLNRMHEMNVQMSTIAGWLMMLTPMMAPFLVKGGGAIMSSAAMQFAGMVNATSGHVAREMTTGNFSFGNTSMGNHSFNNVNGNKHDINAMEFYDTATRQLSNGATQTQTSSGANVYNTQGAISNLGEGINFAQTSSEVKNRSLSEATRASENAAATFNQNKSDLWTATNNFVNSDSVNQGYGDNASVGTNTTERAAYSRMMDIASGHGHYDEDTTAQRFDWMLNGSFKSPGKGWFGGIGGGLTVGGGETASQRDSLNISEKDQQAFNSAFDVARTAATTHTANNQHNHSDSAQDRVETALSNTVQAGHTLSQSLTHERAVNEAINQSSSDSATVNAKMEQQFVSWAEGLTDAQRGDYDAQTLLTSNDWEVSQQRQDLEQQFVEQLNHSRIADIEKGLSGGSFDTLKGMTTQDLQAQGKAGVNAFEQQASSVVDLSHDANQDRVALASLKAGNPATFDASQSHHVMNQASQTNAHRQHQVEAGSTPLKRNVSEKTSAQDVDKGAVVGAIGRTQHAINQAAEDFSNDAQSTLKRFFD